MTVCIALSGEQLMSSNVQFWNKAPYLARWLSWTFSSILSLATSQFLHFLEFAKRWLCILCSVLFLSHPRSEDWPNHARTFSIYLYALSFWLTLPQTVLYTSWCCLSRLCVVFLTCIHRALFLALFLSPGNSLVSSWCDHSMLASLLWQCLTVLSLLQLCWEPLICFLCCPQNTQNLSQSFYLKGLKMCFFILSECPAFTAVRSCRPH